MATIKDVAKRANVSISTVSHVINHTKNVSVDTKLRVEQAIRELNYKTNIFAKNLKSQETKQIGVVVLDMCGLFFPYVIREICRVANENGYTVTLLDSRGSIEQEKKAIAALVESCVDGIILSSVIPSTEEEAYALELRELLSSGTKKIPLVIMERDFTAYGIDSICTDNYTGGLMAMEHLTELGCRHIAHISAPGAEGGRYQAYRTVLEKYQLPFSPDYVERGDFSHVSGYSCMKKILDRNLELDGVFAANDQMAVGVIRALHEAGLKIPQDVKVIGYDDVFICDTLNPPLSSINIEKKSLGGKSISLLLERIQNRGPHIPCKEVLEGKLVVRNSTDNEAKLNKDWY